MAGAPGAGCWLQKVVPQQGQRDASRGVADARTPGATTAGQSRHEDDGAAAR